MYESTIKAYRDLKDRGIEAHSEEWKREIARSAGAAEGGHAAAFVSRDAASTATFRFYPMDRRRGEAKNWYTLPIEERARQMNEHGLVGRRYAGEVRQIITGSIGFDDWEWGVDLFADDPLVFKKLIYEMRFDEVSAVYALFGQFYLGLRVPAAELGKLLSGDLPAAESKDLNRRGRKGAASRMRTWNFFATFAVSFASFAVIFCFVLENYGDSWTDRIQRREPGSAGGL